MNRILEPTREFNALREFNARWALPVYSVFQDQKSNGSDEKSEHKSNQQGKFCLTKNTKVPAFNAPKTKLGNLHIFLKQINSKSKQPVVGLWFRANSFKQFAYAEFNVTGKPIMVYDEIKCLHRQKSSSNCLTQFL